MMISKKSKNNELIFAIAFVLISAALIGLLMKDWNVKAALVPFFVMLIIETSLGGIAWFIIERSKKLSNEQVKKRLLFYLLAFYASTYVVANLSITIVTFVAYLIKGYDLSTFIPNLFKYELSAGNSGLHLGLMAFTIVFFFMLWQQSAKKEAKLNEEKLKYQYQTLKSRLNPHFLFNSFNALSELVYEDAKLADEYIQELSNVYRYLVENEEVRLVELEKELSFVNKYFNLQNIRNNGNVKLAIDIDGAEKVQVIPVSIQMMVENAIKHNRATPDLPLIIKIEVVKDMVVVSNNLQRKITMENSTKQGLNSLKEQINLLFDKNLEVIENENQFVVKIPTA